MKETKWKCQCWQEGHCDQGCRVSNEQHLLICFKKTILDTEESLPTPQAAVNLDVCTFTGSLNLEEGKIKQDPCALVCGLLG